MRHERCSDDESDSYPRIGYQHFIDPSRACLALEPGICLAVPRSVAEGCPIGPASHHRSDPSYCKGLKISACLSFLALGLQANRPDEASQLSGHGHASLVDLHPPPSQCRKPPRQPQLRLPGCRSDRLRERFLAGQRFSADSSLEAIVPGRFGQEPAVCAFPVLVMLPRLIRSPLERSEGTRPR